MLKSNSTLTFTLAHWELSGHCTIDKSSCRWFFLLSRPELYFLFLGVLCSLFSSWQNFHSHFTVSSSCFFFFQGGLGKYILLCENSNSVCDFSTFDFGLSWDLISSPPSFFLLRFFLGESKRERRVLWRKNQEKLIDRKIFLSRLRVASDTFFISREFAIYIFPTCM